MEGHNLNFCVQLTSPDQIGDPKAGNRILQLIRLKAEKEVADGFDRVDLLLLDGSFFGFRVLGIRSSAEDLMDSLVDCREGCLSLARYFPTPTY